MEQRLDLHEQWLKRHDLRLEAVDDRVKLLEHDRGLVSELAATTLALGKQAGESLHAIDEIAERAVENVYKRRREARRGEWKFWAGWLAASGSIAGLLFDHLRHLHL